MFQTWNDGLLIVIASRSRPIGKLKLREQEIFQKKMKSSVILFVSLIGLAITVLSAPIPSTSSQVITLSDIDIGAHLVASLSLLGILIGLSGASHLIRGFIERGNTHNAIDYYFNNVKQWELEKLAMRQTVGRNKTKSIKAKAPKNDLDSENPEAVLARMLLKVSRR